MCFSCKPLEDIAIGLLFFRVMHFESQALIIEITLVTMADIAPFSPVSDLAYRKVRL